MVFQVLRNAAGDLFPQLGVCPGWCHRPLAMTLVMADRLGRHYPTARPVSVGAGRLHRPPAMTPVVADRLGRCRPTARALCGGLTVTPRMCLTLAVLALAFFVAALWMN